MQHWEAWWWQYPAVGLFYNNDDEHMSFCVFFLFLNKYITHKYSIIILQQYLIHSVTLQRVEICKKIPSVFVICVIC